jgi:hypothetical protein
MTPLQHHFPYFMDIGKLNAELKPNLAIKEDFHERFVIVILHGVFITVIPFDRFNETGGDPLYMWPALASIDIETGKLYGHGMRMGSFEEQLDKSIFK